MRRIRIGTRGSQLALWQANYIQQMLETNMPGQKIERIIIKTEGDRDQKSSLTQIGGQGVFTKAIEDALLNNEIDIAVHSLKDLPSLMTDGLTLAAVPPRGPVEDVLVSEKGLDLNDLPEGAVLASGSIRRRSQLLYQRPDLQMRDLRGNIDTRLRKLSEQDLDGIIMARAALVRLQLKDVPVSVLDIETMIPAVGQGAVGVQTRIDDTAVIELAKTLSDSDTYRAVTAERAFLRELDSGCQFPVGAYAKIYNDKMHIAGFVGSEDGKTMLRESVEGNRAEAEQLGEKLAGLLINRGAREVLSRITNE